MANAVQAESCPHCKQFRLLSVSSRFDSHKIGELKSGRNRVLANLPSLYSVVFGIYLKPSLQGQRLRTLLDQTKSMLYWWSSKREVLANRWCHMIMSGWMLSLSPIASIRTIPLASLRSVERCTMFREPASGVSSINSRGSYSVTESQRYHKTHDPQGHIHNMLTFSGRCLMAAVKVRKKTTVSVICHAIDK